MQIHNLEFEKVNVLSPKWEPSNPRKKIRDPRKLAHLQFCDFNRYGNSKFRDRGRTLLCLVFSFPMVSCRPEVREVSGQLMAQVKGYLYVFFRGILSWPPFSPKGWTHRRLLVDCREPNAVRLSKVQEFVGVTERQKEGDLIEAKTVDKSFSAFQFVFVVFPCRSCLPCSSCSNLPVGVFPSPTTVRGLLLCFALASGVSDPAAQGNARREGKRESYVTVPPIPKHVNLSTRLQRLGNGLVSIRQGSGQL